MRSKLWTGSILLSCLFLFLLLTACGGVVCTGSGCYTYPWYPWYPWYAQAVTAADLDGDGAIDLLILDDGDREIHLATGAGAAKPEEATRYPVGEALGPCRILPGHFDADGIPDLAVFVEETGTLDVHLGNGDGTFAPATEAGHLALGPDVVSITISPLDDDALVELLVIYADGRPEVYTSDGAGGFAP